MPNLLLSKHSLLVALEVFKIVMENDDIYEKVAELLDLSDPAMEEIQKEVLPILDDETNAPIVLIPDVGKMEAANER